MRYARLLAAVIFLCLNATTAPAASDPGQLKRDYDAAKKIVDGGQPYPGFGISDSTKSASALEDEWNLVAEWVVTSLHSHTSIGSKEISTIVKRLDKTYDANVLQLDSNTFVIGISRGEIGTFFVVRNIGSQFKILWSVHQAAQDQITRAPLVNAWTATGARDDCRQKTAENDWDQCGAIYPAQFGILAKDTHGNVRFYVDAEYSQIAGGTTSFQLSVWTWDGKHALPLYVKSYFQEFDFSALPKQVGNILHIEEKNEFKSFISCGECGGRQVVWALQIKADGIHDLGTKSLTPELDALDNLVDAVHRGLPTDGLAAPAVVADLKPLVAEQKSELIHENYFSLGMLGNGTTEADPKNHGEVLLCFSTDNYEDRRVFSLRHAGNGYFIAGVQNFGITGDTPDKLCTRRPTF